jgi:hypothetical protein
MKYTSFIFSALLVFPSLTWAQPRKPATIAELVTYRGADREQLLYAGAKTEGKITWYTSLAGDSYKELVKAFENKYPGVKVESYRAAGADLVARLQEEAKARTPSRPRKEASFSCATTSCSVPMIRRTWTNIRRTERNGPKKASFIGPSRGNLILASHTTKRSCRKMSCQRISMDSYTHSSKVKWASALGRRATR